MNDHNASNYISSLGTLVGPVYAVGSTHEPGFIEPSQAGKFEN